MSWNHTKSSTERGYGWAWQKTRDQILTRDHHLCQPCKRNNKLTPAQEVDHITPKAQGGTDDMHNLQSICTQCHKEKTIIENGGSIKGCDINGMPESWAGEGLG